MLHIGCTLHLLPTNSLLFELKGRALFERSYTFVMVNGTETDGSVNDGRQI